MPSFTLASVRSCCMMHSSWPIIIVIAVAIDVALVIIHTCTHATLTGGVGLKVCPRLGQALLQSGLNIFSLPLAQVIRSSNHSENKIKQQVYELLSGC